MSRGIKFSPGEFYHLYNRGTERRTVFLSPKEYERFVLLLYIANNASQFHLPTKVSTQQSLFATPREKTLVDIAAYCLMPNHFHLLIREKEKGGISRFMQKLMTGYTMYFNAKQERSGVLFQGKFKATHAVGNRYLKYLIAYIHLNPVKLIEPKWKETGITHKKRAEHYLIKYRYSSYPDHIGQERPENNVIEPRALLEYDTPHDFKASILEWLSYKDG